MASRSERRGSRTARVILAGGLLALAASIMPAQALDPAPAVRSTSVDTGWSGSDRVITARFSENLDPGCTAATCSPIKVMSTATLKKADGAAMPIENVTVSNDTISLLVGESPHPDLPP